MTSATAWPLRPSIAAARPLFVVLPLLLLFPALAGADVIHMKGSDSVIEGVIDEERSDESRVFIRTREGLIPIPRNRIDRIEVRGNVTEEEREGDLAIQRGDYDAGLDLYLRAYSQHPDDETLRNKIAEAKERIERSKLQRYAAPFADIDSAVRRRVFHEAIELAEQLIRNAPDQSARAFCEQKLAEIYMAQARDYTNMVNYSEAEKAYRNAIAIAPGSAEAQLELAELISSAPARRDEAFALYREGLTYASKDPTLVPHDRLLEHRYNEAQLYLRESQYREAADLYWEVLQADDEGLYPRATEFIVRALTSIRSQLVEENPENARALGILEGVVSRDPGRADAHYLLGRIHCDRENWEETAERMETAVRALVGPNAGTDRAEARHCLAQAYRHAGRIQDAAVQLQALLSAQPSRYDALCELGEIYAMQLEHQRALSEFNKAIGVDPGVYRAYIGAARTQRQLFRYADALNNYKKLIELRGDHPAYLYEIGQTYADLNDHRSARQHLLRAIELIGAREGDSPSEESRLILSRAYTQLGLASVAERNYYEAIQSFDRALANYPDLALAYDGKGQAYRELGQLEDAESFFQKALSQDPGNPQFLLNLGIFFHKFKKDRAGALPYYMKYFEHGGNDPQVRDWIRECGGTPPSVS